MRRTLALKIYYTNRTFIAHITIIILNGYLQQLSGRAAICYLTLLLSAMAGNTGSSALQAVAERLLNEWMFSPPSPHTITGADTGILEGGGGGGPT